MSGNVGNATIAGHVNDPLGQPEIIAHLQDFPPGDLIIVQLKNTNLGIRVTVDEIEVYSVQQSSDSVVLTRIFGPGQVARIGPQPAPDGLFHLMLVTCAGYIKKGEFGHHTVVSAIQTK